QYLTFYCGEEIFGINILYIKEIKEFINVTSIPMMPDFIKGVINLRGNVVPVVDLSLRFSRRPTKITKRTCIIIVEIDHEGELVDIGVLVDSVSEVLDIPLENIEKTPNFGSKLRLDFINGLGKIEDEFIVLLNIKNVFSIEELSEIESNLKKEN
ncbi:MAG: chemotaxis protein CheW, partial [Leptospiraceae bacterium]|nr:chemotaxis protein CheW [Leptospiraceae bacterium]